MEDIVAKGPHDNENGSFGCKSLVYLSRCRSLHCTITYDLCGDDVVWGRRCAGPDSGATIGAQKGVEHFVLLLTQSVIPYHTHHQFPLKNKIFFQMLRFTFLLFVLGMLPHL